MKGNSWSDEETALMRQFIRDGYEAREIVQYFPEHGKSTVYTRYRAVGLEFSQDFYGWKIHRKRHAHSLFKAGGSPRFVAKRLGISIVVAQKWHNDLFVKEQLPGELDKWVWKLYNDDWKSEDIAEDLGVTVSAVNRSLKRLGIVR